MNAHNCDAHYRTDMLHGVWVRFIMSIEKFIMCEGEFSMKFERIKIIMTKRTTLRKWSGILMTYIERQSKLSHRADSISQSSKYEKIKNNFAAVTCSAKVLF